MKNRSKYFLGLLLLVSGLIIFSCFSIIFCFLNFKNIEASNMTEFTMSFVYLFIHFLILCIAAYFVAKAYFQKPSFIPVIMTFENGEKNPKAYRNTLIFSIIFGIIGVFFFLNSFNIISLTKFLSIGLNLSLTNVGFSISLFALYCYFYKPQIVND